MAKILIIDDERSIRNAIREILEYEKFTVDEAEDGLSGVVKVKGGKYDVILCDIKMPKMDGMEVLERILLLAPDTPVVMISGHGDIETAVDLLKHGAYDYIPKPLDLNRLLVSVRNALDRTEIVAETKKLEEGEQELRDDRRIGWNCQGEGHDREGGTHRCARPYHGS